MDDSTHKKENHLESLVEKIIFRSRWILAVFYLVLVFTLGLIAIRFLQDFYHFATTFWSVTDAHFINGVLEIVDKTLIANLLILIIFSGYENFVSVIGIAQRNVDRPKWMGGVDFGGLKLKLIGSIIAISGVQLLAAFLEIHNEDKTDLAWQVGLHVVFLFTGILYAYTEKISAHQKHTPPDSIDK
jgi:uncharacterized protein (TIGR00645 family)